MGKTLEIEEDVPLAPRTTFRIGGNARFLGEVTTEQDLLEGLVFAEAHDLPVFILGGGSNLLVRDAGFNGVVLHVAMGGPIVQDGSRFDVPSGINWDALVLAVCQQGFSGMECLAGIPGLVGASPIQNIGAYGQEVAQVIHSVRAFDRLARSFVTLGRQECGFRYRESIFNTSERNRYIVTRVCFTLDPHAQPNLGYADLSAYFPAAPKPPGPLVVYQAVREIRRAKGMLLVNGDPDCQSAGSFFKNPIVSPVILAGIAASLAIHESQVPRYPTNTHLVKLPAAWLLDKAGFHKGLSLGAAGISSRHTLALINRGSATYEDIAHLRERIVKTVNDRFGITLEQEPVEP